jgi:hypothetical protein
MSPTDQKLEGNATAAAAAPGRDALGNFCFYLHFAVMIFIVTGFLVPARPVLGFYLGFLPLVTVQWWFNKNSCVLNNLESFIRTGSWRHETNPEEGAWLRNLARDALGLEVKPWQVEVFTYCVMGTLWFLGAWHLRGW